MSAASKESQTPSSNGDQWMTVKAAAVRLGCSRHEVQKRAAAGELTAQLVADRLVISRESVERALSAGAATA